MITPYYERDNITIYCGDCLEVMPQLDVVFDLGLTDPPYGIKICSNAKIVGIATDLSRRKTLDIWDDKLADPRAIKILLEKTRNQIVFGANYYWEHFYSSGCYIIWDKRGDLPDVPFSDTEFAWTSFVNRPSKRYVIINHGFIRDAKEIRYHPTQKPLSLMRKIIVDFSSSGHIILDPFMGSGTTLAAAQREGRRAVGVELSEDYCKIAADRLRQPSFFSIPPKPKEPKAIQLSMVGDDE